MGEVIALLAFIFAALWGSAVLISYLQNDPWKVKSGDDEDVLRLREEIDELRHRLAAVEDQVSFDRQLRSPASPSDADDS